MTPSSRYLAARANLLSALGKATTLFGRKALSVNGYRDDLLALSQSNDDQYRLYDRIAALIILYALWAYNDGLTESGADPLQVQTQQATGQTTATVNAWVAQQTTYAAGLAQAMAQNNVIQATALNAPLPPFMPGGLTPGIPVIAGTPFPVMTEAIKQASASDIINRVGMWAESLNKFRLEGMVKGAELGGDDPIVKWELGQTEEHCQSEKGKMGCLNLSMQAPERLSNFVTAGLIPRAPGNEEIVCGGWKCDCRLVRVADGKQVM